jgi:hypothetical protein
LFIKPASLWANPSMITYSRYKDGKGIVRIGDY